MDLRESKMWELVKPIIRKFEDTDENPNKIFDRLSEYDKEILRQFYAYYSDTQILFEILENVN